MMPIIYDTKNMKLSEYTQEKLIEIARSDDSIDAKVRAILCRIDFELGMVEGGLLDQNQERLTEVYMEGYRKAKEN